MPENRDLPVFLRYTANLLGNAPSFREAAAALAAIAESAAQPFNLAVVGRMKAGKSTLINGLIGRRLAISDVEEATATLNWICYGSKEQETQFLVHWREGGSESFPLGEISKWTGKSAEVLERAGRTSFLRLFAEIPNLAKIQIIDTPGTGSAVEEHEIAEKFLNPETISRSIEEGGKADAILYVIPPVGREQDEETLRAFSGSRLPNSGPYNSLAVLHKWDSLEVDDPRSSARGKAERLLGQLEGMVADVLPVSGPMALAARTTPVDLFSQLLFAIPKDADVLRRMLRKSERWDADVHRAALREAFLMPWASFRLLTRLLHRESITDPEFARQRCLEESGILELETALQERFFSRQSIIKQCQILTRAAGILDPNLRKLDDATRKARISAPEKEPIAPAEIVDCDRQWQKHRSELEGLHMDLRVANELPRRPDLFPEEDRPIILSISNHLASLNRRRDLGTGQIVSLARLENLIGKYRSQENAARNRDRPLLTHVVTRFEQIYQILKDA